jgi:uncharacterized membrane protein
MEINKQIIKLNINMCVAKEKEDINGIKNEKLRRTIRVRWKKNKCSIFVIP